MNEDKSYCASNLKGDILAPNLTGVAMFKPFKDGTMVEAEISNLPGYNKTESSQLRTGCHILYLT